MTRSERDLVVALRSELAGIDPARPCDRLAEAAGLGDDAWNREAAVTRLAVRLERRGADRDGGAVPDIDWDAVQDHCRWAWLRGRFLARGSLSLASGRTHLEFIVEADEAPVLAERLAGMGLPAAWRLRRGRGVVTWKSGEAVGTFLRRIGAGAALLELEARQVSRALRGEINRVINAESANLHRAVASSTRSTASRHRASSPPSRASCGPLPRLGAKRPKRPSPTSPTGSTCTGPRSSERSNGSSGLRSRTDTATPGRRRTARPLPAGRSARVRAASLWHDRPHA